MFRLSLSLVLLLAACSSSAASTTNESAPVSTGAGVARAPAPEANVEERRVTIAAVGDVLPHRMVKAAARARGRSAAPGVEPALAGFSSVFASLGRIAEYDVAMFNMESPVVREALLPPMRLRFFADPAMPRALANIGFDIAVCSNNHAFDQGGDGLVESIGHLRAAGLRTVGCGRNLEEAGEPIVLETKGIRLGVLSFTRVMNANNPARRAHPEWPHALFWYDDVDPGAEVLAAIRKARARDDIDVLVVNAHWDREYSPIPLEKTRALAAILVSEGVDLVVGHHAHVLEPAEWMRGPDGRRAAVIYSLGNFVHEMCANRNPLDLCDRRLSAVAVATFAEREGRVELDALEFEPAWMDHREACPGEQSPRSSCVRPVLVRDELARIDAELERGQTAALLEEREGFALRDRVIRRFMGPHEIGASPRTPYVDVDPAIVSRSRHGPRRPFRD